MYFKTRFEVFAVSLKWPETGSKPFQSTVDLQFAAVLKRMEGVVPLNPSQLNAECVSAIRFILADKTQLCSINDCSE